MKNLMINHDNYFVINEDSITRRDEEHIKDQFKKYAEGILNGEGGTLTVEPGQPLDMVSGFFKLMFDVTREQLLLNKIPKAMQQKLRDIAEHIVRANCDCEECHGYSE